MFFGKQNPKIENIEVEIINLNSFISEYSKFSPKLGSQILTLIFKDIKELECIEKFNNFFYHEKFIPNEITNLIYNYYLGVKEKNTHAEFVQINYLDNIKNNCIILKKFNFIDFKKNIVDIKINQKTDQCIKTQNYLIFSSGEENINAINFGYNLWYSHAYIFFVRVIINGKVAFCKRINNPKLYPIVSFQLYK